MNERFSEVGRGVTLCYETFGEREDPPILMVMGLATQMIGWHEGLCRELAGRGFFVVRFDNRDIGRSTHFDFRPPTLRNLVTRRFAPEQYDLADMAEDTLRLMRELEIAPAHVVGASMGGMISQTLAARHPEVVRSLVSVMSNTGSRRSGQPHPSVYRLFLRAHPADPEAALEQSVALFRLIGSPPPNQDLDQIRELARQSMERDRSRASAGRQLGALLKSGDRTRELRTIEAPTLVIHGTEDKLISASGGKATARAIPGSKLMMLEGMGHDLPRAYWQRLLDAIEDHVRAADREVSPAAAPGSAG